MNLTDEEKELIRRLRDAKASRLDPHATAILDEKNEPTGKWQITEVHLTDLLDRLDSQKRELDKWAAHQCAGTEG